MMAGHDEKTETADGSPGPRGLVGQTLEGFRVLKFLGRGGMGEVYLAHEESLGRNVVLKFLATRLAGDQQLARRFTREARAAARLNHPNVVTIYSVHESGGLTFFAMELVEGEPLAALIAREAPLDAGRALAIADQTAQALACAHKAGVLHRDVKPTNIIVSSTGFVKVLDFGIAKIVDERSELTTDGAFLGTLAYASPEQCEGADLDPRTDVYSLGVILYEMLAGRPPYEADTPISLMKKIATEDPPDLETFNPHVSPSIQRLIGRMIDKDRERRMPDCGRVIEGIGHVRREIGGETVPLVAPAAPGAATVGVGAQPTATKAAVPLGRPVSAADVAGQRRWFFEKRWMVLWVFLFVILFAVLAGDPNRRRNRRWSRATPTPVPTLVSPTPAATVAPAQTPARPTATPAGSAWPTPTPAVASRTPTTTPVSPRPSRTPFSPAMALQLIPPDRDLAMGFDIRSLLASQLIRSNESKVFSREALANLDAFFGYFFIDWRRDIDYLALFGPTSRPDQLCATFWGRWDEATIIQQLSRRPDYRVFQHGNHRIHGVYHAVNRRMECVVFLAPGVAACGTVPVLQQVCDSASGQASAMFPRQGLMAILPRLSRPCDFWVVGKPLPTGRDKALAGLNAWVLTGQLAPDLVLEGVAWPRDTSKIEGVFNLLRLVVQSWRNNRQNPDLQKLGSNIILSRSANTLSAAVRIPYIDLVKLLDAAAAQGNYPFK